MALFDGQDQYSWLSQNIRIYILFLDLDFFISKLTLSFQQNCNFVFKKCSKFLVFNWCIWQKMQIKTAYKIFILVYKCIYPENFELSVHTHQFHKNKYKIFTMWHLTSYGLRRKISIWKYIMSQFVNKISYLSQSNNIFE